MSLSVEKRTIKAMIRIYCNDLHKTNEGICNECEALLNYAFKRIDHCKFNPRKPACNKCPVHCYMPSYREKVREVMRYSGKKMPLRHPWLSLLHLIKEMKKNDL